MSSINIALEGGLHHGKTGWYHDQDGGWPEILYVTVTPTWDPMVFADAHSPFAPRPLLAYRYKTSDDEDTKIFEHHPEGDLP